MSSGWLLTVLLALQACHSDPKPRDSGASGGARASQAGTFAAGAPTDIGSGGTHPQPDETAEEELLYDFGQAPPANVYHLLVDGDSLYFAQKASRLMRAAKAGGAAPERFADFENSIEGGPLRADETYVYFYDGHFVKRKPKLGGDIRAYDVGMGNDRGNFIVDGDFIYQAGINCSPVLRIDKESGATVELTLPNVADGGGFLELALVGSKLYCATVGSNGGHVYEIAADAEAPLGVRDGTILWGVTPVANSLVFTSGANGIDRMKFYQFDVASHASELLVEDSMQGAGELAFDAERNAIFINYSTNLGHIGYLDLTSLQFHSLIPNGRFLRDAFATDDTYVYWAQQGPAQPEQIRRIRKDAVAAP